MAPRHRKGTPPVYYYTMYVSSAYLKNFSYISIIFILGDVQGELFSINIVKSQVGGKAEKAKDAPAEGMDRPG